MQDYHSRATSQGMRRAWHIRGRHCNQCGRRYLKPKRWTPHDSRGSYYAANRDNPQLCPKCDPTHQPERYDSLA